MRGGFLAGGGHTAIVSGVGNIRGAVAQISANNAVINNILATKLEERARLAKGVSYAAKSSFADRQAMNKAFDEVKKLQQRITAQGQEQGDPEMVGIADELIEDQRKMYNRIFNIANSKSIQDAAIARGIEVGSSRYNTLVSLVDFARQEGKDALQNIQQKIGGISTLINQTLWNSNPEDIDDTTLHELVESTGGTPHLPSISEYGPQRSAEWLQDVRAGRIGVLERVNSLVDYIAHLDALMTYRDQIELKDVKTEADKRKLRSINKQLDELRNSVKTRKTTKNENGEDVVTLEDNELSSITTAQQLQKYVYDTELHEVVRDQYRDVTNFTIDLDHANAMSYNLIGEDIEGARRIDQKAEQDILDKVSGELQEYNTAVEGVTDNKNVQITETGLKHGELDEKAAKRANKVIDRYLKAVKDDEQFEQEIHDDISRAIDELYGQEQ